MPKQVDCELIGGPADGLVIRSERKEMISVSIYGPFRPSVHYKLDYGLSYKSPGCLKYRYMPPMKQGGLKYG